MQLAAAGWRVAAEARAAQVAAQPLAAQLQPDSANGPVSASAALLAGGLLAPVAVAVAVAGGLLAVAGGLLAVAGWLAAAARRRLSLLHLLAHVTLILALWLAAWGLDVGNRKEQRERHEAQDNAMEKRW